MDKGLLEDGVTVVVSTYNAADLLKLTLESLSRQHIDSFKYEVIVVDDGSTDDSRIVADQFTEIIDIRYYRQRDEGFRVASARNAGIALARYKVTLFLDTGMVAADNLVKTHWNVHSDNNNAVVIGLSYGLQEFAPVEDGTIERMLSSFDTTTVFKQLAAMPSLYDCRYMFLRNFDFELASRRYPWVLFWTGHVSCRTHALHEVKGFDENFKSWGGEDVELGLRLHGYGCRYLALKEMLTINYPHPRCESEKKQSSLKNIRYIHSKHKTEGTKLLFTEGWMDIIEHRKEAETAKETA